MCTFEALSKLLVLCGAAFATLATLAGFDAVYAGNIILLHSFIGGDGSYPIASLIRDSSGNLYGTTSQGGSGNCNGLGCGAVFKLPPDGTETVLHAFTGGNDGGYPRADLIMDSAGSVYGTTSYGGTNDDGVVFKVDRHGAETVLYDFAGGYDGSWPVAGLVMDISGNLYGTTSGGGLADCQSSSTCGTVFKLAPDGTETVLHAFTGGNDGEYPWADLIRDAAGNLYGTTPVGGGGGSCLSNPGCGTVFKVAPDGTERVLHAFTGGTDGGIPEAALVMDAAGFLYGTTPMGGGTGCEYGCGTVFKVAPDGTETVLYAFTGGTDGGLPEGSLTMDKRGNLYGTTNEWGICGLRYGCGTVFKLAPDGTKTVLGDLARHVGKFPVAGPIRDSVGDLYGMAEKGGAYGYGTVFELKK